MAYVVVVLAYVLSHGLTVSIVSPTQSHFLPNTTVFAALIYLPHGVRVLSAWAFGWKAFLPLYVASLISVWLLTPDAEFEFLSPHSLESHAVGSASGILAFELFRLAGHNLYSGCQEKISWKSLIGVGAVATAINSVGQTIIYSGLIGFENLSKVLLMYAIGDLLGLIIAMVILMLVFRWIRPARV